MKLEDYIKTRLTHHLKADTTEQQMIDIAFDLVHELKEHDIEQEKAIQMISTVIRTHTKHLKELLEVLSKLS